VGDHGNGLADHFEIAARENESPQAVAAKLGRNLQNTYSVMERDGVAIIPVTGPLFPLRQFFTISAAHQAMN
jgi:hypothetical protein